MSVVAHLFMLLLVTLVAVPSHARVKIDLNQPGAAPIPIAVTDFYATDPESQQYAVDVAGVIRNNFSTSTPFKVLKQAAFLQTPAQLNTTGPVFADWKGINADALLTGTVQVVNGNQIRVEYRLYDTQT